MTEYYKEKLEQGNEYQDFVMNLLIEKLGIALSIYGTKKYQWKFGENKQGVEIKFDDNYKTTGNLYIEISEKTNKNNPNFIPSGIFRDDNSWLYLIGNYEIIYIFTKKMLKGLYRCDKYLRKVEIPTSRGFLLQKSNAEKYSAKVIIVKEKEK